MLGIIANSGSTTVSALETLTFVGSNSTSGTSLTYPAGTTTNDVAVLFRILENNVTGQLPTLASGFTNILSSPTTQLISGRSAYRQILSGDTAITLTNPTGNTLSMVVVFRPNFTPTTITAVSGTNSTSGSAIAVNISSESTTNNPYLAFAHYGSTSIEQTLTPDIAMTEIDNGLNGTARSQTVLYKIYNQNDTGQAISVSSTDSGTNLGQGFTLAIA